MLVDVTTRDACVGNGASSDRCARDIEEYVTFFNLRSCERCVCVFIYMRNTVEDKFAPADVLAANKRSAAKPVVLFAPARSDTTPNLTRH